MQIGDNVTYIGKYHTWATGQTVKVKAVIRGEEYYFTGNEELERAGGVQPGDIIEFQPYIQAHNGEIVVSFVSSDAPLSDFVESARLPGF